MPAPLGQQCGARQTASACDFGHHQQPLSVEIHVGRTPNPRTAQALGYKNGALKIIELRQRATKALGPKLKLSKFHELVLSDGTLPLGLLEAKVDRWLAEQK